jgi:hypothetical protein
MRAPRRRHAACAIICACVAACLGPEDRVYDDEISDPSQATHFVGGSIHGLKGMGLALQNNKQDTINLLQDGTFRFASPLHTGDGYNVIVSSQPTNPTQRCVVSNGIGTIGTSNVTNLDVGCTVTSFKVSGTVTGLTGIGLVLALTGGPGGGHMADEMVSIPLNGSFTFPNLVPSGDSYNIMPIHTPDKQTCTVMNGLGTVIDKDIMNVAVTCMASP